jgi:hypothetical protein
VEAVSLDTDGNLWPKKRFIYTERAMDAAGLRQTLSTEVACALRERLGACIWIRLRVGY